MKVTREFLLQGANVDSWNKAQILILGHEWWPLKSGWIDRIEQAGVEISQEAAKKFLSLKGGCMNARRRKMNEAKKKIWLLEWDAGKDCGVLGVFSSDTLAKAAGENYLKHSEIDGETYIISELTLDDW